MNKKPVDQEKIRSLEKAVEKVSTMIANASSESTRAAWTKLRDRHLAALKILKS